MSRLSPSQPTSSTLLHKSAAGFCRSGFGLAAIPAWLFLAAAGIAFWLAFTSLTGSSLAGCGASCSPALSSRWAYLFGLPVSLYGAGFYLLTAVSLFRSAVAPRRHSMASGLVMLAVLAAVYFIAVQAWVIRSFCTRCLTLHALAFAGAFAAWCLRSRLFASTSSESGERGFLRGFTRPLLVSSLGVAALAAVQQFGPTPPSSRTFPAEHVSSSSAIQPLQVQDGVLHAFADSGIPVIDPRRLPLVHGPSDWAVPPGSGVPLVFVHDWTCEHCRALHARLDASMSQAGASPLLIVALPGWKEPQAEKVHRLMLTAWFGARPVYVAAENALVSGQLEATPEAVEGFLASRNGASWPDLVKNLTTPVEEIMKLGAAVLTASESHLSVSTLPQLLSPHAVLVGNPSEHEFTTFLATAQSQVPVLDLKQPVSSVSPLNLSTENLASSVSSQPMVNDSQIEFTQTALKLEPVHQGQDREAIFAFTNSGTDPLTISGVQTSCGCTMVNDWQQTVAPGGKGSIRATFHSAGRPPGPQVKTIIVRSSAKNAPLISLSFQVEILPVSDPVAAPAPLPDTNTKLNPPNPASILPPPTK